MLHRLEAEGLIEPVRAEQEGRRPQRTVYAITDDGWKELAIHRDRALTQPVLHSTTVEMALDWPAGLDYDALRERLSIRRSALARALADLVASRELHLQEGHLPTAGMAGYRRTELHLEAELAWHDELDAMLPAIAAGPAGTSGAAAPAQSATPGQSATPAEAAAPGHSAAPARAAAPGQSATTAEAAPTTPAPAPTPLRPVPPPEVTPLHGRGTRHPDVS